MNIHRHIKTINGENFLLNISYTMDNKLIVLHNFTMHPIIDGIVGADFVKKELIEYDDYAFNQIFEILKKDGVL